MRVLHLVNKLDYGGVLRHVLDLVEGLENRGVQGSIAAWAPPDHELQSRGNFTQLPLYGALGYRKSFFGAIRSVRLLRRYLVEKRVDILHIHSRYAAAIGAAAARGLAVQRVYTLHSVFTDLKFLPFYPSKVICSSESSRRSFLSHARFSRGADVAVIPHGVSERDLRAAIQQTDAEFLFIGRLEPRKRADLILKASAILNSAPGIVPSVRIVGSGSMEAQLRREAEALGLQNPVRFEGYRSDVFASFRNALALVFPSDSLDSVGYVNLEAFSIGVPVIASDLPQLRELIRDGETGLLFPPGDAEALAGRMRYALEHPEEMEVMGRKARDYVREQHSMEGMLAGTFAVYKRLMTDKLRQ